MLGGRDERDLARMELSMTEQKLRPAGRPAHPARPGSSSLNAVEFWDAVADALLVPVVAGLWLALAVFLTLGLVWVPFSFWGHDYHAQPPERLGTELALLPLAAIAGARAGLSRPRRWWLPHASAVALVAMSLVLVWSWNHDHDRAEVFLPGRLFGAALVAMVGFGGAVLYPRLTAILAGAIGAPMLFGVVAYAFSWELINGFRESRDYYVFFPPWGIRTSAEGILIVAAGTAVSLWLLVFALLTLWFRRWHLLGHAAWSGAITLYLAVYGLVSPLARVH